MLKTVKDFVSKVVHKAKYALVVATLSCTAAIPALAAEAFDPTSALVTSFESMATSILATISATLPVVMSIMSAFICIKFGIKFFTRFVK